MRILNSFSMGRSSAYQSFLMKTLYPHDDVVSVTANTGQEHELSIAFGRAVDDAFDLHATVVEAVVDPRNREGTTHRVVTWDTAHFGEEILRR